MLGSDAILFGGPSVPQDGRIVRGRGVDRCSWTHSIVSKCPPMYPLTCHPGGLCPQSQSSKEMVICLGLVFSFTTFPSVIYKASHEDNSFPKHLTYIPTTSRAVCTPCSQNNSARAFVNGDAGSHRAKWQVGEWGLHLFCFLTLYVLHLPVSDTLSMLLKRPLFFCKNNTSDG